MIYPVTLYNFGKVCKSSLAAGNVLRALCKQAVKLTPEEETIFAMIQNDSGWMDERVEQQRERWKERQRKSRMSRNVTVTKCDTRDTHNVTMPSSLPPSKNNTIQDSTKHLRHNTTRSVAVRAHARGDADGNGDVNGGFLVGGGRSQLMVDARAFADDVHGDAENGGNAGAEDEGGSGEEAGGDAEGGGDAAETAQETAASVYIPQDGVRIIRRDQQ